MLSFMTDPSNRTQYDHRAGFSLVEVSLAILVVAVGLLAVYGLFPSGLNASKRATDEVQAVVFAEEVINGVRALAEDPAISWSQVDQLKLPGYSQSGLPTPGPNLWEYPDDLIVVAGVGLRTNKYMINKTGRMNTPMDIANYAVRYDLDVRDLAGRPAKAIRLEVWNGEYGPTNESVIFYSEIYNTGHP
jgi:prepilin-type N-terminal cleavage/methylation domain-containing protein